MKKIVSLLAILALVFAMVAFVGCDNGNGGTPGKSDVVDGSDPVETFTPPENVVKEVELVKNPYADGGALETQIKIPTGIESLAVGDKVRLVMKGAVNPALGAMEICLVDTTEAAGWWKMLDDNKYVATDMVNFDIDYTFTVTQAPIGTGPESMMIVINGKDNDETKTMYCTEFSVTKVADDDEGGDDEDDEGATVNKIVGPEYTVTFGEDSSQDINFTLQVPNTGAQDDTGLKVTVKGLSVKITVGDKDPVTLDLGDYELVPDQYAWPDAYCTSCAKKLLSIEDISKGTEVKVQASADSISPSGETANILYAFQRNGGDYQVFGIADNVWKPAFAKAE